MPPKSGSGNSIFKKLQEKKEAEARAFAAARGTQASSSSAPTPAPPSPPAVTTIHEAEEAALQHALQADITVTLRNDDSRDTSTSGGGGNKKGRSMSEIRRALCCMELTTKGGGCGGMSSGAALNKISTSSTTVCSNPTDDIVGLSTRRDLFVPPQCPLGDDSPAIPLPHHILVPLEPSMQWRRWIGNSGSSLAAFKSQTEQLVSLCISDPVKLTSASTTTTKGEEAAQSIGGEDGSSSASPSLQGWGVSSFGRAWLRSLRLLEGSYPLQITTTTKEQRDVSTSSAGGGGGRRSVITVTASPGSTPDGHHYYLGTISNPLGGNSLAVAVVPTSFLFSGDASDVGGCIKLAMTLCKSNTNSIQKKDNMQRHQHIHNGLVLPADTTVPLLAPVRGSSSAAAMLAPLLNRGLMGLAHTATAQSESSQAVAVTINVDLTRLGYTSGITSSNVGGGRYPSLRGLLPTSNTPTDDKVTITVHGGQMIDPLYAPPTGPNTDAPTSTASSPQSSKATPLVASSWGNMPLDVKRLVLVEQLLPEMKNINTPTTLTSSVVSSASSTHPLLLKERFRSTLQQRIEKAAAAHHCHPKPNTTSPNTTAADKSNTPKEQGLLHTAQQLSLDLKELVQRCVPVDVVGDHPREVVRDVATKLLLCTLQRDAFERYGIDIPKGVLLYDAASSSSTQKQQKKDMFPKIPVKGASGAVGKTFLLGAMARTIAAVNRAVHSQMSGRNDKKMATTIKGSTLSISVDAHSLITKEVGGTEKNIALLMKLARRGQVAHFATQITSGVVEGAEADVPVVATVVFIDNLEVFAPPRKGEGGGSGTTGDRALSTLLTELDGIRSTTAPPTTSSSSKKNGEGGQQPIATVPVIIVASSSGLNRLDPAVYRPGRLDLHIPLSQVTPATAWKVLLSALAPLYDELFGDYSALLVESEDERQDWGLNVKEMSMLRKLVPVMFPINTTTTTTTAHDTGKHPSDASLPAPIFTNFGSLSGGISNPFKTLPHLTVTDAKLIARQATYRFVGAVTALKTFTVTRDESNTAALQTPSKKLNRTAQDAGIRRWLFGEGAALVEMELDRNTGGIVGRVGLEACQVELSAQVQAAIKLVSPLTLFK